MTAKIHRKLLFALASMAISLFAFVPGANAATDDAFEPGAFAKAHAPLELEQPAICPGVFQCAFPTEFGVQPEDWAQALRDSPDGTQAGGHPDFVTHFRFVPTGGTNTSRTIITDAPAGA